MSSDVSHSLATWSVCQGRMDVEFSEVSRYLKLLSMYLVCVCPSN